jgi:hypothetical protein
VHLRQRCLCVYYLSLRQALLRLDQGSIKALSKLWLALRLIHIHTYIHTYIHIYMHMGIHTYIHYIYTHTYMYVDGCVLISTGMYIYIYRHLIIFFWPVRRRGAPGRSGERGLRTRTRRYTPNCRTRGLITGVVCVCVCARARVVLDLGWGGWILDSFFFWN